MRLRKLKEEASERVEVKSMACRLVRVAVTVEMEGRVFGEGKRFIWRENIAKLEDEIAIPFLSTYILT